MEAIDAEVLAALRDDVHRPAAVEQAIALALEALQPERQDAARDEFEPELATVRAECDRPAEAIGRGGPLDALLARLQGGQARRDELEALLAVMGPTAVRVTTYGLEARLRAKLADWRGLLAQDIESARDVLRLLLAEPLRFTPITDARRARTPSTRRSRWIGYFPV